MRYCFLFIIVSIISPLTKAQELDSPADFLGYELGSAFSFHHKVIEYFEYAASASAKVELISYGKTYENRPLMVAAISSPENIQRLDEIAAINRYYTGREELLPEGKHIPIVWFGYNIHGNESVSTEVAMAMLYALVSQDTASWLEDMVVIIDPCMNPDGRERYAQWYRQAKNKDPNPRMMSYEHHEPWPGGRVNHYLFDLNRDWAWQSQIESQQRADLYFRFMPQVLVDFHEMGAGAPYFFGPAARPLHEVITDWQRQFQQLVGENNASYFDKHSWMYFTREVYDLLYPSYGDTWSTYNGAVGFTYEQGGSGRAGLQLILRNGDTLKLTDRMAHHFTSGWATLETSHQHKEELLDQFKAYFKKAVENPDGPYQSYIISGNNPKNRVRAFLELLDKQQIKYSELSQSSRNYKAYAYQKGDIVNLRLNEGDILISASQPQSHMVKVLMEPDTYLEDSSTYDLTSWALPYVFDLEAYAMEEKVESLTDLPPSFIQSKNQNNAFMPYAWAVIWDDLKSVQFLSALLNKGVKVRYTELPFKADGKWYDAGTLLILRSDNRFSDLAEWVPELASAGHIKLHTISSGFVEEGKDFGSSYVNFVPAPHIGLVNGQGVSPGAFGELWHYFEQELDYPVTVINTEYLSRTDLNELDVLILASGSYGKFKKQISEFVRKGGTLIAMDRALSVLTNGSDENPPLTKLGKEMLKAEDREKAKKNTNVRELELEDIPVFGDRIREYLTNASAGSIYEVELDETHPLSFGLESPYFVMKRNGTPYPYLPTGEWNVGIYKGDAHRSGFIGSRLRKKLKNTLAFGVESMGAGRIVYFPDSPIFRQFWYSGKLLLGNAVFLLN